MTPSDEIYWSLPAVLAPAIYVTWEVTKGRTQAACQQG